MKAFSIKLPKNLEFGVYLISFWVSVISAVAYWTLNPKCSPETAWTAGCGVGVAAGVVTYLVLAARWAPAEAELTLERKLLEVEKKGLDVKKEGLEHAEKRINEERIKIGLGYVALVNGRNEVIRTLRDAVDGGLPISFDADAAGVIMRLEAKKEVPPTESR